jgi:hypothetical protein
MSKVNPGDAVKLRQATRLYEISKGTACWIGKKSEHNAGDMGLVISHKPCECGHCTAPVRYVLLIDGKLVYAQRGDFRRLGLYKELKSEEVEDT